MLREEYVKCMHNSTTIRVDINANAGADGSLDCRRESLLEILHEAALDLVFAATADD